MDAGECVSQEVVLRRYGELRDAARDMISADPRKSPNVHDTYVQLCTTYDYPVNKCYVEYLTLYAAAQAAIAAGSARDRVDAVRCLDFRSTYVGRLMWLPIFVTLADCVLLRSLSMACQQLDSDMMLLLTRSLSPLVRLTRLDVSGNPIGCAGVQALVRLVQSSPALVECDIHGAASIAALTRQLDAALARNQSRSAPPPPMGAGHQEGREEGVHAHGCGDALHVQ